MTEEQKICYFQKILEMIAKADPTVSAPEIVAEVVSLQKQMFGKCEDYSELKKYYNGLMSSLCPELSKKIETSPSPLRLAAGYSMLGNYIDFGAMDSVDEKELNSLLETANDVKIDEIEFANLKRDLSTARNLVFLTDNCGEIALDKLFMTEILKEYPNLSLKIIVRGTPVLNDATVEDALQVGLDSIAEIVSNGSDIAGTCLSKISDNAKTYIDNADLIIAKGQGNFETLRYCGKNVYYMFLCKCQMFADRFNVPRFTPMLLNDLRMTQKQPTFF